MLKVEGFDNVKNSLDIDYTYNNKYLKGIILDDILKDYSNKNRDFNKTLFFRKIQKKRRLH